MSTPTAPDPKAGAPRRPMGRAVAIGLSLYAGAIFGVLWVGSAVALATGGAILVDAWAWLTSQQPVAAVVGLVAWTLLAVSGLVRTFQGR